MASFTDYTVEVHYPGSTTSVAEARSLLRVTGRIRELIRQPLGLF